MKVASQRSFYCDTAVVSTAHVVRGTAVCQWLRLHNKGSPCCIWSDMPSGVTPASPNWRGTSAGAQRTFCDCSRRSWRCAQTWSFAWRTRSWRSGRHFKVMTTHTARATCVLHVSEEMQSPSSVFLLFLPILITVWQKIKHQRLPVHIYITIISYSCKSVEQII